MRLSRNFYLYELTKSQTAERHGIDNSPSQEEIKFLKSLCIHILQPIRDRFGVPITPSSGYRSLELNRLIGSKDTSDHVKGMAVDFEVPGKSNYQVAQWIEENLEYSQLILEFYRGGNTGWIHCSYNPDSLKRQSLTFNGKNFKNGLVA